MVAQMSCLYLRRSDPTKPELPWPPREQSGWRVRIRHAEEMGFETSHYYGFALCLYAEHKLGCDYGIFGLEIPVAVMCEGHPTIVAGINASSAHFVESWDRELRRVCGISSRIQGRLICEQFDVMRKRGRRAVELVGGWIRKTDWGPPRSLLPDDPEESPESPPEDVNGVADDGATPPALEVSR